MKSILILSMALAAVMASSASAVTYTDTNVHNTYLTTEPGSGNQSSLSGQWSYGPIGAGETIVSVSTWFTFSSPDGHKESAKIEIGTGEGPIDFTKLTGSFDFGTTEVFSVVFGTPGSLFADAANGFLSYVITAIDNQSEGWSDFTFNSARVDVVTATPDSASTVGLLGLGLVGLAFMRRRSV